MKLHHNTHQSEKELDLGIDYVLNLQTGLHATPCTLVYMENWGW